MIPDGFGAIRERWLSICEGKTPLWEEDLADLRRLLMALDDFDEWAAAFQESFPEPHCDSDGTAIAAMRRHAGPSGLPSAG
jgi:hypothetical protein